MPIKDLLWACPLCHRIEGIGADDRCLACGASFRRGRGANIVARAGKGAGAGNPAPVELAPATWLARLPWPDLDGDGRTLPPGMAPPFRQNVVARMAIGDQPVIRAGDYLGRVEQFGPKTPGQLELSAAELTFQPTSGDVGWHWPLAELTSIQPASSSIQLQARGRPVVSLRFQQGSLRLWEQRLQYCVRQAYRAAGRGEIVEFQPRIRVR